MPNKLGYVTAGNLKRSVLFFFFFFLQDVEAENLKPGLVTWSCGVPFPSFTMWLLISDRMMRNKLFKWLMSFSSLPLWRKKEWSTLYIFAAHEGGMAENWSVTQQLHIKKGVQGSRQAVGTAEPQLLLPTWETWATSLQTEDSLTRCLSVFQIHKSFQKRDFFF